MPSNKSSLAKSVRSIDEISVESACIKLILHYSYSKYMQKISFIDMFSGAGLFSGGAAMAGMTPAFALDLSKDAVDSYNMNIAPVAQVGSVLDVLELPAADVLLAGPP